MALWHRMSGGAALLLAAAALAGCGPSAVRTDAGRIDLGSAPEQRDIHDNVPVVFERDGWRWTLTPRAHYVARGQVLSRQRYHTGPQAGIAPCDLAIGWGPLILDGGYQVIDWSQSDRFYYWRYPSSVAVNNDFIASHSANTHIIPATTDVGRVACRLHPGAAVELDGELVDVHGEQGPRYYSWTSSLSRADRGAGSCEVMYVRRITVDGNVYE